MSATSRPSALPCRALLLGALLLPLLVACKGDAEAEAPKAALAVAVAPVEMRELASGITVSGPASPVEAMQLGVEVSGLRVTALPVDVGQKVRRGDLLLQVDHRMLDADLAQASAALREAEAGAQLARANLTRGESLAGDRYISAMQLDELRAARTQGEARLGTARAARDTAALRRSFADLRAPADGIISHRFVQPGQVVAAGTELLRLIRDGRLEWRADLPASQLAQVSPGDPVRLRVDDGNSIDGRVRAVSPGVDAASRTGTIFVDLPPGLLEAGTVQADAFLEGRIDVGSARVLAVPAAAIVLRDGFPTVFSVDGDGVVRQHRIQAGARDDGFVAVEDGIDAGMQVVVEGAGFLAEGDRVQVVPRTDAAAPTVATEPAQ
ncbi:MAG: efflux RND transporter periplasmic adaptor subunit [Pseudoxanthomonas suwonensis]|nr:efflux RND transporter periplasmic adaptor subunit [Pseudoxanthomonas suwonensis]